MANVTDIIILFFSIWFFVTVVFYVFNLPVNGTGLRYREWLSQFPKFNKEK